MIQVQLDLSLKLKKEIVQLFVFVEDSYAHLVFGTGFQNEWYKLEDMKILYQPEKYEEIGGTIFKQKVF